MKSGKEIRLDIGMRLEEHLTPWCLANVFQAVGLACCQIY